MMNRAYLGGVTIGDGLPVAVAGALNGRPETSCQPAVMTQEEPLLRAGGRAGLFVGGGGRGGARGGRGEPQHGRGLGPPRARRVTRSCPAGRGERIRASGDPIAVVRGLLEESLGLARAAGIDPSLIAVDPGIGFFRSQDMVW